MKSSLARFAFCLAALFFACAPALAQGEAERHLKRGLSLLSTRDVDGAIAELDKAVALKPDYVEAYEHRSRLRMLKGNLAGALADMDMAVGHAPDKARLYFERGHLRMMSNDPNGALADLDAAIAHGQRSDEVYASRGHLKMRLGRDVASAADDFTTAISLNPSRLRHYLGRYGARSLAGDKDGALVDLDYVIGEHERREKEREAAGQPRELAPEFHLKSPPVGGPQITLPPGERQTGKESEKVVTQVQTQTALRLVKLPDGSGGAEQMEYLFIVAGAYLNRGHIHDQRGDAEAALRDYDKSIAINPNDSPAYYSRARVRRGLGRLRESLADLDRTVELEPRFPFHHLERGATLLMLNRDAEAEKSFAEAVKLDASFQQKVDKLRAETLKKREARQD